MPCISVYPDVRRRGLSTLRATALGSKNAFMAILHELAYVAESISDRVPRQQTFAESAIGPEPPSPLQGARRH